MRSMQGEQWLDSTQEGGVVVNWDLGVHSSFRHEETGLVGNVLDVHTGEWMGKVASKN